MKRLLGKLTVAFAIVASVAMISQSSAHAANAGVLVGGGTISPGLTLTPTNQSFSFTTTAAVGVSNKPVGAGAFSCSFTGNSSGPETDLQGAGTGTGSCSGTVNVSCTISYTRVVVLVVVTGSCSTPGGPQTLGGVFVFVPTTVNPVTSYVLVGTAATVI
jgi:hypothetical protein